MAFVQKADSMFKKKMKLAVEQRDWNMVENLFHWYGCYMELIEPIPTVDPEVERGQQHDKALSMVGDGDSMDKEA